MSEHTKGPWRQGDPHGHNATTIYPDTDDRHADAIASVYGIPMHTSVDDVGDRYRVGMANARLIASAPDLLEALVACHAALAAHPDGDNRLSEDLLKTRAAIARATGAA